MKKKVEKLFDNIIINILYFEYSKLKIKNYFINKYLHFEKMKNNLIIN